MRYEGNKLNINNWNSWLEAMILQKLETNLGATRCSFTFIKERRGTYFGRDLKKRLTVFTAQKVKKTEMIFTSENLLQMDGGIWMTHAIIFKGGKRRVDPREQLLLSQ